MAAILKIVTTACIEPDEVFKSTIDKRVNKQQILM